VHLGADLPAAEPRGAAPGRVGPGGAGPGGGVSGGAASGTAPARRNGPITLVTVGHLVARKRHGDVIRALWSMRGSHPDLRYVIIGDGPEREPLEELSAELGVGDRVEFTGQLAPDQALTAAREATLFVMPSTEEAFGVVYIEAMAAGVPAIGCRGESGPEEIARAGEGIVLVPPGDVETLAREIDGLLTNPEALRQLGDAARSTVEREFTWERCGKATVQAYEDALRMGATR